MTSGEFTSYPVDKIFIDRDKRQRRQLKGIDDLAESISRTGLINPIVIRREDGQLVAGERRLTAVKQLGWTHISVQFTDELDPLQLHLIELEENTRRLDLTWQEECNAILEYDRLRKQLDPTWTRSNTASALGLSEQSVSDKMLVAAALEKGDERVKAAPKLSTAVGVVTRARERQRASIADAITRVEAPELVPDESVAPVAPLICADFSEWAADYDGPRFNLIHCDFPYGVNADRHAQGAAKSFGGYEDGEEVYWNLVNTLSEAMNNVVAESAHLIFWFSMDYYHDTLNALNQMGWRVNPFPLIWFKSDNTGILPDASRGPRRVYETAFFASRGDRKVVQAVGNAFAHPGRNKEIHMSEKPRRMLRHFMRMVVDEYSHVLDPTCGSGNAVRVAKDLGAKQVLGIERDPEFHSLACDTFFKEPEDELLSQGV